MTVSPRKLACALALGLCAAAVDTSGAQAAQLDTVQVLDSARIPWDFKYSELSGLAWDKDEQLLYAVSDLGHIIHFKLDIKDDHIAAVTPVFIGPLVLPQGQEKFVDAEDLVAINASDGKPGNTEIAVVFEDGPAAARFSSKGDLIDTIDLPTPLIDRSAYRQVNQRLESIVRLSDGTFVMGPQTPLLNHKRKRHTLYATDGRQWTYKAYQKRGSSTKALELLPDGSLLILEAENDGGFLGMIGLGGKDARIRRLDLSACADDKRCPVTDYPVASGDPIRGRFEGIANVGADLYVMVTDETFGSELMLLRLPWAPQ